MTVQCRFCPELTGDPDSSEFAAITKHELGDRVFLQGSSFALFPSLGPLVHGHVLLAPLAHVLGFGLLEGRDLVEAEGILDAVRSLQAGLYGRGVIAFEHGALSESCMSGACVEHAHIHILPCDADIAQPLSDRYGPPEPVGLRELRRIANKSPGYLWFQNSHGVGRAWLTEHVPSQLMRHLVAKAAGIPERGDWRNDPGQSAIAATLKDLDRAGIPRRRRPLPR